MTTERHAATAAHRTGIIRNYLYQNDARYDDGWQTVTDIHRRIEADGWVWSAAVTRSLLNRMAETGDIVREVRRGRVRSGTPGIFNERKVSMYCLPTPREPQAAMTTEVGGPIVVQRATADQIGTPANVGAHITLPAANEATPADAGDPVERARLFAAAYPDGTRYGGSDVIVGRSAETSEVLVRDDGGVEWWRAADMPDSEEEADYIRGNLQMRAWSDDAYLSDVYTRHRATQSHETSMLRARRALFMAAWDDAVVEHVHRYRDLPVGFEPYPPVGQDCDTRTGWGGSVWCKLGPGHEGDHDPDPYVAGLRALAYVRMNDPNVPLRIEADLNAIANRVDGIRRRVHSYSLTVPQAISELTGPYIGLTVEGARAVLSLSFGQPLTALA